MFSHSPDRICFFENFWHQQLLYLFCLSCSSLWLLRIGQYFLKHQILDFFNIFYRQIFFLIYDFRCFVISFISLGIFINKFQLSMTYYLFCNFFCSLFWILLSHNMTGAASITFLSFFSTIITSFPCITSSNLKEFLRNKALDTIGYYIFEF